MKAIVTVLTLFLAACNSPPALGPTPGAIGFDGGDGGPTWSFASTGGTGPTATWQVRADAAAVSPPNVMALVATNHDDEDRFNLCWSAGVPFQNGRLQVSLRADRGAVDQGGGPMWRVQDADNYYVCRVNPLESNYRVYVVSKGVRRQLGTALVDAKAGTWHRVEVEHHGAEIRCSFDGVLLLEASDNTIPAAGGVGLWTKADACTSFDDLLVRPSDS
ncbi:MAG TPA: hypothetical protein VFZ65_21530 [Planctomycetota bacterium]|nr:hypothetical protein [Planctomycetota bacterium]